MSGRIGKFGKNRKRDNSKRLLHIIIQPTGALCSSSSVTDFIKKNTDRIMLSHITENNNRKRKIT